MLKSGKTAALGVAIAVAYSTRPLSLSDQQPMFSDEEYKRIYWASRRGMLELDLVLMPFVERHLRSLDEHAQRQYVRLLESEDTELFAWFLGRERPTDPELAGIVEQIIAFARTAKN